MGRFTVIPQDTFQALQLDAGVVLTNFDPSSPAVRDEDIVCATTGGINITCTPEFSDLGEDVDNCPVNMMELKKLESWSCGMSFTSIGTSARSIRFALGAADYDAETGAIKPRRNLKQDDFADLWWVGDRADGGCVAIQLKNALATAGFSLQTTKAGKGQVSVELTGHVSINAQDEMPMVIYSLDPSPFELVTVEADDPYARYPWTDKRPVDFQSNIAVADGKITGTMLFQEGGLSPSGPLAGDGYFLALKFSDLDPNATSVKVGLDPSQGTGLVEIIDDPDKNAVFKITDKNTQQLLVVSSDGVKSNTQIFRLNELVEEGV